MCNYVTYREGNVLLLQLINYTTNQSYSWPIVFAIPSPASSVSQGLLVPRPNWERDILQIENRDHYLYQFRPSRLYLLHTMQLFSSVPSPQPSLPEHTMALERHLPLPHLIGQYRRCRFRSSLSSRMKNEGMDLLPQRCAGSSLPSRQEIIALQNSYSGRHSPLRHWKVFSGHWPFRFRDESQFNSSSPWAHCLLPSQSPAREIHLPLWAHLKVCSGHCGPSSFVSSKTHSSSDPSLQSGLPSHTKNQLMQTPLDRHWKVPLAQPV